MYFYQQLFKRLAPGLALISVSYFPEHQLHEKFLRLKGNKTWSFQKNGNVPLDLFTDDVALMLSDVEINQMVHLHHLECEIVVNPGKYLSSFYVSFIFQKDFALKELIDFHLLKFQQSGLLKQLERKYLNKFIQDCAPEVRELNFHATCLAFVVLVIGVVMAVMTSVAEKLRLGSALKPIAIKMINRNRIYRKNPGNQKHNVCSTGRT